MRCAHTMKATGQDGAAYCCDCGRAFRRVGGRNVGRPRPTTPLTFSTGAQSTEGREAASDQPARNVGENVG